MNVPNRDGTRGRDALLGELVEVLEDVTSDWDMAFEGPIRAETEIVRDLAFESIDVVQLIAAIEERFDCKGLPFEELLMTDGRYVDDLRIGEIADFLDRYLNTAA